MRMIVALIGINDLDTSFHYTDNLIWWYVPCIALPPLRSCLPHPANHLAIPFC